MDLLLCFSGTGHKIYQWPKQGSRAPFSAVGLDFWSLDNGQTICNDIRKARNLVKSQLCRTTSGRQWTAAGFFIYFYTYTYIYTIFTLNVNASHEQPAHPAHEVTEAYRFYPKFEQSQENTSIGCDPLISVGPNIARSRCYMQNEAPTTQLRFNGQSNAKALRTDTVLIQPLGARLSWQG